MNTWVRDKKSTKVFNDKVDEKIQIDMSLEENYKSSLIHIRADKALDLVSWKSIKALSAYDATMDRETWWKELLKIRQFGYNRN